MIFSSSLGSFSKLYNSLDSSYSLKISFHFEVLTHFVLGFFGGADSFSGFAVSVYDIISSIDLNVTPFKIEVTTKDVFWNDIVTGGHTLYFNVCQNKNLLKIQNNIAQSLQPLRKKVPNPYDPIDNKIFYESFEKYGFPYTGLNWKPHFTVASIRTNKTNPIITEFLSINSKYN